MLPRVMIVYLTLTMIKNAGATISTPQQSVEWHHIIVPEENTIIISSVLEVMGT
jgi:hypothetical protein